MHRLDKNKRLDGTKMHGATVGEKKYICLLQAFSFGYATVMYTRVYGKEQNLSVPQQ